MNFNQLKYFNTVYLFRSVSKAAGYLHISQPSLSNSIKEMENEFGVVLFNRLHGGMEPTSHGDILFNMSKDIMLRLEQTQNIMKDVKNSNKLLRLGVPPMLASMFLPGILSNLANAFPGLKLYIIESGREHLLKKLVENEVDMIFIPHEPAAKTGLSVKKIGMFEIACCVPAVYIYKY